MHRPADPVSHRTSPRRAALALCGAAAVLALCSATPNPQAPPPCAEVVTKGGAVSVRMPEPLHAALQAAAPGFRPFSMADYTNDVRKAYHVTPLQAPWAVVGDFDADGFCDLLIDGRTRTDTYRLCAWGAPEGPRVMTLGRRRVRAVAPSAAALALVPRSVVAIKRRPDPRTRLGDGFEVQVAGKPAQSFYWKQVRFARLTR